MSNEDNGVEYIDVKLDDVNFNGMLLDYALAMADPALPVFGMYEGTYPGNHQKHQHCLVNDAVIVDLEWKLWIEGPVFRTGRWEPTKNWGQLGPYIEAYGVEIAQPKGQQPEAVIRTAGKSFYGFGETIHESVCKVVLWSRAGETVKIPKPLYDIHMRLIGEDK